MNNIYIGKNSAGKSYKLVKNYEKNPNNTLFLKFDFNIIKDIKNNKDTFINKINKFINTITNYEYTINNKNIDDVFKKSFLDEYNLENDIHLKKIEKILENINKIENEINNDKNTIKVAFKTPIEEKDIPISIKATSNKKMKFDNWIQTLKSEESGSGEFFYTIILIISKILKILKLKVIKNQNLSIIIDEPERFLHPNYIKKIALELKAISQHGVNIFCASHSPLFIKYFTDDINEIILLEKLDKYNEYKLENSLSIPKEIINYKNKLKNSLLTSQEFIDSKRELEWQINSLEILDSMYSNTKKFFENSLPDIKNNFIESLFYKKIILCEGQNDKIILDSIILNNDDVYVLITWGKYNMPFYIDILKKYNKVIYCVFDKDDDKKPIHNILNNYNEKESNAFFKFPKNLEKYFNINSENKKTIWKNLSEIRNTDEYKKFEKKIKLMLQK